MASIPIVGEPFGLAFSLSHSARPQVLREGPCRFRAEVSEIIDGKYRRLQDFGVFASWAEANAALSEAVRP